MSVEAWTLAAAVVGAGLAFGGMQIQSYLDRRRKLKAYARLLCLEELKPTELKLRTLKEGEPFPYLSIELWKAARVELASLLKDQKLLGSLCLIAYCVEVWNAGGTDVEPKGWDFNRSVLLTTLDDSLPALERIGWGRLKK